MGNRLNHGFPRTIFIVGVGRSGTSLLQSMFAAHSDVCMLPETSFLRRYSTEKICHKSSVEISKLIKNDKYLKRLGFNENELEEIISQMTDFQFKTFYELISQKYCHREFNQASKVIGDKDPRMVEYIPLLKLINSDGQIIHVIRDPRDILLSKKKAKWSSKRHPCLHIFANKVQIELGCDNGRALPSGKYHQVIYEDLLRNPEKVLKRLCADTDLPFDESMLSGFGESAKKLVDESELSWKKETFGPLLKDNVGKWRGVLQNWEIALIELTCKRSFIEGGYVSSNAINSLNLLQKIFVWSLAFGFSIFAPFYKWYRNNKVSKSISCNANNAK